MSTVKLVNGFVWAVVSTEIAEDLHAYNQSEMFMLYPDGSESAIRDDIDFGRALNNGLPIALELGHKSELQSDYDEACARNNETRSFTAWLEAKAESLIN